MATAARDGSGKAQKHTAGRQSIGRVTPAIPHALGTPRSSKPNSKQSFGSEDTVVNDTQHENKQIPRNSGADPLVTEGTSHDQYIEKSSQPEQAEEIYGAPQEISEVRMEQGLENSSPTIRRQSPEQGKEVAEVTTLESTGMPPGFHDMAISSTQTDQHVQTQRGGQAGQPQFYESQQQPQRVATFPDFSARPKRFSDKPTNHQSRLSNHSIVFGDHHDSNTPSPASVPVQKPHNPQAQATAQSSHVSDRSQASRNVPLSAFGGPDSRSFHASPYALANHYEYSNNGAQQHMRPEYQHPGRYSNRGRQYGHANSSRHQNNTTLSPGGMFNHAPQQFVMRPDQGPGFQKAVHPETSRAGQYQEHRRRQSSINSTDGTMQMDTRMILPEDLVILARYLCSHFGNAEFADYLVQFSHSMFQFPPTQLPAHGLILARSPKLRSLMSMPNSASQNGLKVLNVPVSDRFLNVEGALMRAVMRLYGETLPDRSDVARLAAPSLQLEGGSMEAAQMRFALAFAASGHFLQIDEIINHALLLIGHMLSWATITKVLAFALDGGLSGAFTQFETQAKDRESNSSSLDGMAAKVDSPASAPAYGFYSDRLLRHVMMFFVYNIPVGFRFYPSAPQLNDPPRLPSEAEPKHGRSASRLSQIRFGDMTLEDPGDVDPITQTISSILVTLPFPLLRSVFDSSILYDRLGPPQAADLLHAVVQERESRRQRVMKRQTLGLQAEEGVWRAVRWEEVVEPTDRNAIGFKVTRSMVGSQTPLSSDLEKG